MSTSAVMPLPVLKEVRALALPALACLACMVVPPLVDAPRFLSGISISAYFLGTAAIGALSMGHEYSGRTLSLLLSLPVSRQRLLAVKLAVLAVTLAILGLAARSFLFGIVPVPGPERSAAAFLPVLYGLFLAPWLTMACRSPIAGAVFTVAIPGVLLAAGELIGVAKYGEAPEMYAFRLAFVWFGTLGLCAIGSVMNWWLFARLEAIEGPDRDVRLPQWMRIASAAGSAASEVTRRNPAWLLVKKELRLQQLPLTLAALFALAWALAASSTTLVSDMVYGTAFGTATVLYAALVSLVIGSSASAAERQMGTLQWQVLIPMAASKQWAIKVTVVLGLAMSLGFGLPTVLISTGSLLRATDPNIRPPFFVAMAAIVVLAAGSVYVSSLCRSGLWALMMSIPAVVGSTMFLRLAFDWTWPASILAAKQVAGWMPADAGPPPLMQQRMMTIMAVLLIGSFIAVLLRFARANHFSADHQASRVWKQVILTSAFAMAAILAMAIMQATYLLRFGRLFYRF